MSRLVPGEAADGALLAGETDDAAAVGQLHAQRRLFDHPRDRIAQRPIVAAHLPIEFLALAQRRGEQEHQGRWAVERGVQGEERRDGRLARLAATEQDALPRVRPQQIGLPWIGLSPSDARGRPDRAPEPGRSPGDYSTMTRLQREELSRNRGPRLRIRGQSGQEPSSNGEPLRCSDQSEHRSILDLAEEPGQQLETAPDLPHRQECRALVIVRFGGMEKFPGFRLQGGGFGQEFIRPNRLGHVVGFEQASSGDGHDAAPPRLR